MSKKSLSDLLREEAKDPQASQPKTSAIPETPPSESILPQNSASGEFSQLQSRLSQAQAQVDTLKAALHQEKSLGEDLKKQLGDWQKADQKQTRAIETAQQTIKTLEQSLKQEQDKVKTLQTELQAVAQLKTELETKKTLVGKLYGKIQDLESSLAAPPQPATLALRPSTMPVRYIAPKQPSSNLTDEDIGWFD